MTHEEAKKAWFAKVPVVSGGIKYLKIKSLVYQFSTKKENEIIVLADLLDRSERSITTTPIWNVEVWNDNKADS